MYFSPLSYVPARKYPLLKQFATRDLINFFRVAKTRIGYFRASPPPKAIGEKYVRPIVEGS